MNRHKKQESSASRRARRDNKRALNESRVRQIASKMPEEKREALLAFIGLQKEVGMTLGEALKWSRERGESRELTKKDYQAVAILKGAESMGIIQKDAITNPEKTEV